MRAVEEPRSASNQVISGVYPRYDAASTGFRNYWFPVLFSKDVTRTPAAVTLLGENVVLVRDGGRVKALHDRCPHRGIPLSTGTCLAKGTITCPYHGWTFDLDTGRLDAVLSDAPDSAICGKVHVKTYPVEERLGLVWVYVGDEPPPPVETDIPRELLAPDTLMLGRISTMRGNWRYAMENAMDEGHARFLHRDALWTFFRNMPAWTTFDMALSEEGPGAPWVVRWTTKAIWRDTYPRVGEWPRPRFWKKDRRKVRVSGRLPCTLRIEGESRATVYHWCVPVDEGHYRRVTMLATRARGKQALSYRLWYLTWARWARLGQFIGQDQWMIQHMEIPPERLYGPDKSITFWRKYCNEHARGLAAAPQLAAESASTRLVTAV